MLILTAISLAIIMFYPERSIVGGFVATLRSSVPIGALFLLVQLVVCIAIFIGSLIMGLFFICFMGLLSYLPDYIFLVHLMDNIILEHLHLSDYTCGMVAIISPNINASNYTTEILLVESDLDDILASNPFMAYNYEHNVWLPLADFSVINSNLAAGEIVHTANGWETKQGLEVFLQQCLETTPPLMEASTDSTPNVTWPEIEEVFNDPEAFQTLMKFQLPVKADLAVLLNPRLGVLHPYWNPRLSDTQLFDEAFNKDHITSNPEIFGRLAKSIFELTQILA